MNSWKLFALIGATVLLPSLAQAQTVPLKGWTQQRAPSFQSANHTLQTTQLDGLSHAKYTLERAPIKATKDDALNQSNLSEDTQEADTPPESQIYPLVLAMAGMMVMVSLRRRNLE